MEWFYLMFELKYDIPRRFPEAFHVDDTVPNENCLNGMLHELANLNEFRLDIWTAGTTVDSVMCLVTSVPQFFP
jgi:hypothetical protein